MNASTAERSTRIRERAQQSWPALPNTASGAAAAAASRSASAKIDVGGLAAELERDALDRLRGARGDPAADLGRAGERDLGDVGVLDQPPAADAARPGDDVEHALGQPGVERDPLQLERGQRGQLGRLQHHGVARRQRRGHLPRGDHEREVPGHDQPDDPERLAKGHVDAAGDRDRAGRAAAPGPRRSSGRSRRPSRSRRGRRRSACRRCGPPASPAPRRRPRARRRAPRSSAARSPGATARQAGNAAFAARHRRVRLLHARARHLGHHLLGGRLDDLDHAATLCDRAAPMSAAITRLGRSSSGCQRTPSAQRLSGHLDRLDRVARLAQPLATSPSAELCRRPGGGESGP